MEYNGLSDAELVAYLRDGNENAFNEIYNRYKGILHVHAYKKLGDFEEAKNVIQEMFSWIWANKETLNDISNLPGYLYRLVKNMVLNAIAHKEIVSRYEASFNDFINKGVFTTDLIVREKELATIIEREINALPPKMKEVFILSRLLDLSHGEISEQLGMTETTVKHHIKGAIKTLRTKLGLVAYLIILLKF